MSGPISFVSCLLLQTQVCFPLQNVCYMAKLYRFCMFGCLEKHPKFFWYYCICRHVCLLGYIFDYLTSPKCTQCPKNATDYTDLWSVLVGWIADASQWRDISIRSPSLLLMSNRESVQSITEYHRDTCERRVQHVSEMKSEQKHQKAVMKRVPYVCLSISNH